MVDCSNIYGDLLKTQFEQNMKRNGYWADLVMEKNNTNQSTITSNYSNTIEVTQLILLMKFEQNYQYCMKVSDLVISNTNQVQSTLTEILLNL